MPRHCDHCRIQYDCQRRSSRYCTARCRVAANRKRHRRSVHFRSDSAEWSTPQRLFNELASEFGPFDLDVCATVDNAKCTAFYDRTADGLRQRWVGTCWMNPPYGREIGKWVRKAWESSRQAATIVCLLPARTDTAWWHDYVTQAAEVRFLKGRIKFNGGPHAAPFPSAVVVFGGGGDQQQDHTP